MLKRRCSFVGVAAVAFLVGACSDPEAVKQKAFESGNRYFEQKKYTEAILEYRNAIKADARFGEARDKLADAYAQTGNARAAYTEQIRAADLLPDNTQVQLKAVTYLLVVRRFDDAKTRVQKVLAREPQNVEALTLYGNALAGTQDLAGAVEQIEQAIQLDPNRGLTYTNLATFKLAQGDRDQARAAFEKAVQLDPTSVPAKVALANFQWGSGDGPAAEQTLKAALAVDAKDPLANRMLAAYYMSSRRAAEAEPYLKTLSDAGGERAKVALADYYISIKRLDQAKAVLEPLVQAEKATSTAALRLAQIAYVEKHTAEAHAALDKILARDPRNPAVLFEKARWLALEGKTKDALVRASAAVDADPQSVRAQYLLGTLQIAARDFEGANKSFTEVLRLNPRAAAAQVQLSTLNLARGDSSSAVQFAQQAVQNAPKDGLSRLALARSLFAQRQTARAQSEVSALLKDYPNSPPVHALNGALKATGKDVPGARAEFTRALQLDPTSMEALNGLVLLDIVQKDTAAARARVDTRLAAQPDRADLLVLAARVYVADKNPVKAEQLLRHLIEVDPGDARGYSLLGQLYLMQHKLDAAKAEFDQRVRLNARDVAAQTMIGMIFEAQKNLPEAKKKYRGGARHQRPVGGRREQPGVPLRGRRREPRSRAGARADRRRAAAGQPGGAGYTWLGVLEEGASRPRRPRLRAERRQGSGEPDFPLPPGSRLREGRGSRPCPPVARRGAETQARLRGCAARHGLGRRLTWRSRHPWPRLRRRLPTPRHIRSRFPSVPPPPAGSARPDTSFSAS